MILYKFHLQFLFAYIYTHVVHIKLNSLAFKNQLIS